MAIASGEIDLLFYVMSWTILAMMLVLLYSLKQVIMTQRYIKNIDMNLEKMVKRIVLDEERILEDLEGPKRSSKKASSRRR